MNSFSETYATVLITISIVFCFFYFISGVEDLVLDFIAFRKRLKPQTIDQWVLTYFELLPQKRIVILVPAWHEGAIIASMLRGNLNRIRYKNYLFLVGCYPNDPETILAVKSVSENDHRVIPVINRDEGPTSKGQMLNELIRYARLNIDHSKVDAYLLQDAEDIIDPWSLSLINYKLDSFDFVQIPVFSLEVNVKEWVAGTYMDEFAESHTKDLLVRESLGSAIPSAGVGTAFSAQVVEAFLKKFGWVFYEQSLTEDYEFGIRNHELMFTSTFAAYRFWDKEKKQYHFIATREYFPKKLLRSIRQKTRWTVGIALQGWKNLGWSGNFSNRYFLFRDRRGVATNIFTLLGYFFAPLCFLMLITEDISSDPSLKQLKQALYTLFWVTVPLAIHRIMMRGLCVYRVYGARALLFLPVRWPVAVFINSMACLNALAQAIDKRVRGQKFHWVKTEHELPVGFELAESVTSLGLAQERRAS